MTCGGAVTSDDVAWLARAVALAAPVQVVASPNPGVGCVLVADGRVVGEGATGPAGEAHAEVAALAAAGAAARGAHAYVTLEPCAHHGRTPPCTDALLAAGVTRVVIGHPDPNPAAAGGAERLAAAGVAVAGPPPADHPVRAAIAAQLEGFVSLVARGRPHVTVKLAQTTDGALAVEGRRWVTGRSARAAVHRWRAQCDAVLVGIGTVLADDPRLDVRAVPTSHQPRPVVLDAAARTPLTAAVARPGAIVVTSPAAPTSARAALRDRGVEVVEVPAARPRGVELRAALEALAARGITSVFAEPGRTLAAALVAAGLVDRLVLHVASELGDGPPARALGPPPGTAWRATRVGGAGADLVLHLVPTTAPSPQPSPHSSPHPSPHPSPDAAPSPQGSPEEQR